MKTTITPTAAAVQPLTPALDDEPRHTPGPWTVEQDPAFVGECHPLHKHRFITCGPTEMGSDDWGNDPSSYVIAKMTDCQNQAANARLIAAAPEMIHALELAATELNKQGCECDCEDSPLSCPVCAVNSVIEAVGRNKKMPFPDLTKNRMELDRKRMAGLLAEAAGLADETAQWLTGNESYEPQVLADALTRLAMDCREASNKVQSLKIVVEVSGGVAEVTTCPTGIECEIIDHDNAKVGL